MPMLILTCLPGANTTGLRRRMEVSVDADLTTLRVVRIPRIDKDHDHTADHFVVRHVLEKTLP
jgi:hypothetical protein